MTATIAASLRELSLDELAEVHAAGDDDTRRAVLEEAARRDRLAQAARKRQAESAEWHDAAHQQFLAAEAATCGNLLNRMGRAKGLDPWTVLWTGSDARAMAYASYELIEFWQTSPRVTVTGYRRQLADARRAEADERARAAYDACQNVPMDGTELPDAAALVAMVRADGPEVLDRFGAAVDELLDSAQAAEWLGIKRGTVYQEIKRHRWPAPDRKFGQSGAWTRRTLILHRAAMVGTGAPGQPRAKRKSTVDAS
jgi:predicted DNA-binding transcriptional regulator AlpA